MASSRLSLYVLAVMLLSASLVSCKIHFAADGRCGTQSGGAYCDPAKGGFCCSISGYCGSGLEYCGSGCQLNCTDDGIASAPTTTATVTATPTSSPSPTPAPSGMTTKTKIIIGGVVGGVVCILAIVGAIIYLKRRKWRHQETVERMRIQSGTELTLRLTGPSSVIGGISANALQGFARPALPAVGQHYELRGNRGHVYDSSEVD